jgi:hypothetical protein
VVVVGLGDTSEADGDNIEIPAVLGEELVEIVGLDEGGAVWMGT